MKRSQHRFNTFYCLDTPAAELLNDAWWNAENYYKEDFSERYNGNPVEEDITREILYPYMIGILYSKINSLYDEKALTPFPDVV